MAKRKSVVRSKCSSRRVYSRKRNSTKKPAKKNRKTKKSLKRKKKKGGFVRAGSVQQFVLDYCL